MKLPLQTAAVVRAGHSWQARRSSAQGVSASFRHDINICQRESNNPKCAGSLGVWTCASGACQCCDSNGVSEAPGGRCVCNNP